MPHNINAGRPIETRRHHILFFQFIMNGAINFPHQPWHQRQPDRQQRMFKAWAEKGHHDDGQQERRN